MSRQSSRSAAEEAIRKSKERCRFCGQPLPWIGRCPCPKKETEPETKTVKVNCVLCGWEGRKHRTEMINTPKQCSKCKRDGVYHASPGRTK